MVGSPHTATQVAQVQTFNSLLAKRIDQFKVSKRDTSVVSFDIDGLMAKVLDSPSEFGFANITG
jgi:phospholipase/lecithinase/hemolysin